MPDNHLNNNEIALELTKAYIDHLNKNPHSQIDFLNIGKTYQFFYRAVRFDIDLLEPKNTEKHQHQ